MDKFMHQNQAKFCPILLCKVPTHLCCSITCITSSYKTPNTSHQLCQKWCNHEHVTYLEYFSKCQIDLILIFDSQFSPWSKMIQCKFSTSKLKSMIPSFQWYQEKEFLLVEQVMILQSSHGKSIRWTDLCIKVKSSLARYQPIYIAV